MEVLKFFKRILTSPIRSEYKDSSLNMLLDKKQNHKKILNIYRIDKNNAGDFFSAPFHYYEGIENILDIYGYKSSSKNERYKWVKKIAANSIIVGGGGLLNRKSFKRQLQTFEKLASDNKKIVLWGVGHNSKKKKDFNNMSSYNIDIKKFGLVGTRDYSMPGDYVPCVSCKHVVFDDSYEIEDEIGIIFHKKTMKNKAVLGKFSAYPSISNTAEVEKIVAFIGSKEKIITDSYHAMYWSMLLGRKVAVIPNSSKFFDFKYKPVFSDFENCIAEVNKATSYTGVLEECRELNDSFYQKVKEYLDF
ncbi:hypothetical protein C7S20_11470 [Christiangramia fulva]|uniref:Polysaccharide pyruvyl transferase domain-containing protein n=1 Tax=Christiangramia fulva TaxID=2126553 RepID=A0A2R3Z6F9_9FLAO|nr:polysaccharide pyruvyl transferase family protein [Christiangramia fulva]AVR45818.1 hypothetical protein C7S20_11470 [Christiangramia fulva]